ncbi:hypothetical protein ElyMa_002457400 [Elysia marginata]|uniref:Uncharacterized protein n=1 Tax=Elysia marginata TaxID=1093978 RepID=A0AAV4GNV9_9GAST|nr:hypothetical protein ElyMa_002457400 [Elysia marginata]
MMMMMMMMMMVITVILKNLLTPFACQVMPGLSSPAMGGLLHYAVSHGSTEPHTDRSKLGWGLLAKFNGTLEMQYTQMRPAINNVKTKQGTENSLGYYLSPKTIKRQGLTFSLCQMARYTCLFLRQWLGGGADEDKTEVVYNDYYFGLSDKNLGFIADLLSYSNFGSHGAE